MKANRLKKQTILLVSLFFLILLLIILTNYNLTYVNADTVDVSSEREELNLIGEGQLTEIVNADESEPTFETRGSTDTKSDGELVAEDFEPGIESDVLEEGPLEEIDDSRANEDFELQETDLLSVEETFEEDDVQTDVLTEAIL